MITRMRRYPIIVLCTLIGALVFLSAQYAAVADSSDHQTTPTTKVAFAVPFMEMDGGGGPAQEITPPWPGMRGLSCPGSCDTARDQCLIDYQQGQRVPRFTQACEKMYMSCVSRCSPRVQ
ncbi:MAG TPA: hypothetical protein VMC85_13700 [Desulfomonilaceae bacterium]|nr:hypothetical protein [Desulfomonilaceae bacterium]